MYIYMYLKSHFVILGAVPIATLNLQKGVKPGWTIPDAWHHQMIYGVSSKGINRDFQFYIGSLKSFLFFMPLCVKINDFKFLL